MLNLLKLKFEYTQYWFQNPWISIFVCKTQALPGCAETPRAQNFRLDLFTKTYASWRSQNLILTLIGKLWKQNPKIGKSPTVFHPPCLFSETKSRKILKILIWERHRVWFTETKSRQKYWVPGHNFFLWNFGNVTERVLRKQNPDHHFWKWNLLERILLIMMTNFFSTGRWLVDSKIAFL